MEKGIIYGKEARERLQKGVDKVVDSVSKTLGARGRNVVINRNGIPDITKDGVTVAMAITLEDEIENMGASLVKEVARKTANDSGDGTTSSSILTQQLLRKGLKALSDNHNPHEIKKGMDKAVEIVLTHVKSKSIDVSKDFEKLKQVATISANGDSSIGSLVSEVVFKTGLDGIVMVDYSQTEKTNYEIKEGTKITSGYTSSFFINNEKENNVTLKNPLIVMYDGLMTAVKKDIVPILLQYDAIKSDQPLLFIVSDINGEALNSLIINKMNGQLSCAAIIVNGLKDEKLATFKDIQSLVGGTLISETQGVLLKDFKATMFGTAKEVLISNKETIIIDDQTKESFVIRANEIKSQIENSKERIIEQAILKGRLARLLGTIGKIYVGGASETDMKERKDRFDDAIGATTAALSEGVVMGGGMALFRAKQSVKQPKFDNESQKVGFNIVMDSIEQPLRILLDNGYFKSEEIISKLNDSSYDIGYDVKNEEYVSMIESGIIDPYKVIRNCLENSTSMVGLLLTTDCVINTKM